LVWLNRSGQLSRLGAGLLCESLDLCEISGRSYELLTIEGDLIPPVCPSDQVPFLLKSCLDCLSIGIPSAGESGCPLMIRFPRKLRFAIEAVLDIAYNSGTRAVGSREINSRQEIPPRYLESVLQQLVRAGILDGVRGPRGGYRLGRERREISLAEIAEAVRSTEVSEDALDGPPGSPLRRIVGPLCDDLLASWTKDLEKITIADLCLRASQAGVESAGQPIEADQ
jgi:Rrf2 family iron-sulfur cluster assembly transcriptional regulator